MVEDGSLWETLRRYVAPDYVVACLQVSLASRLVHRIGTACSIVVEGISSHNADVFPHSTSLSFWMPCSYASLE